MARPARKRYVIRLHPVVQGQITAMAEKRGYLPATFMSNILEQAVPQTAGNYKIYDEDGIYQLRRGPGNTKVKQTSVYLSDVTFDRIGDISRYLMENVDRDMTPVFVIRDMLTKWLDENG